MPDQPNHIKGNGPAIGLLFASSYAIVGGVALGAVAGYGASHIPSLKLLVVLALALCSAPGAGYAWIARWHDLPGRLAPALLALLGAAAFSYTFIVSHLWAIMGREVLPFTPAQWSAIIQLLREHGEMVDLISGERHRATESDLGGLKLLLVLVPMGAVIFTPLVAALSTLRNAPFCKRCRRWLDEPVLVMRSKSNEPPYRLQYMMTQQRYEPLLAMEPASEDEPHLKVKIYHCTNCGGDHFLRVSQVRHDTSTGKLMVLESTFVRNHVIPAAVVEQLRQAAQAPTTEQSTSAA